MIKKHQGMSSLDEVTGFCQWFAADVTTKLGRIPELTLASLLLWRPTAEGVRRTTAFGKDRHIDEDAGSQHC